MNHNLSVRTSALLLACVVATGLWQAAPLAVGADSPSKSRPGDAAAEKKVREALRTEFERGVGDRAALLAEALTESPEYAPAHWAQGDVQLKGKWVAYEDASQQLKAGAAWKSYREMRRDAEPTVAGQIRLADFCRKNKLSEQERAHLTAIVGLEPEHPTARRRLGEQKIFGIWMSRKDADASREHSKAVAEAIRKNKGTYHRLSEDLKSGEITQKKAVEQLEDLSTPEHIPGLEVYLSTPHKSGALAVVMALGQRRDAEGSVSLVRHALGHPADEVRAEAAYELKDRDWQGFVPLLVAALQSPVRSREELVEAPGNQLIWRRVLYADKQDEEQLAVLDRVFQHFGAFDPLSGFAAAFSATVESRRAGQDLDKLNAGIEANNARLIDLLGKVTGQQHARTPDEWWTWWDEHGEVVDLSAKKRHTERSRTAGYSGPVAVVACPPRTRILSVGPVGKHSCLAPGTEIWTDAGPVAVDLIQPGDLVVSQDAETGELAYKAVLTPTNRPPARMLRLHVGEDVIRSTGGHAFWVSGRGWLKARDLKPGMLLHTVHGAQKLADVEEETEDVKAFNLVVSDFHTYFVGKHRVLSYDNTSRAPAVVAVPGLME